MPSGPLPCPVYFMVMVLSNCVSSVAGWRLSYVLTSLAAGGRSRRRIAWKLNVDSTARSCVRPRETVLAQMRDQYRRLRVALCTPLLVWKSARPMGYQSDSRGHVALPQGLLSADQSRLAYLRFQRRSPRTIEIQCSVSAPSSFPNSPRAFTPTGTACRYARYVFRASNLFPICLNPSRRTLLAIFESPTESLVSPVGKTDILAPCIGGATPGLPTFH